MIGIIEVEPDPSAAVWTKRTLVVGDVPETNLDRDDGNRGADDRAFFIQELAGGDAETGAPAAAVSGGAESPMAALVFLGAAGPGGAMTVRRTTRTIPSACD